jgi:ribosomal protein S18 acetylase RimI-like enzyme
LRPASEEDLAFVIEVEQRFRDLNLVGADDLPTHQLRMSDPNSLYLIVEEQGVARGHVILCGLQSAHRSLELKRIVIAGPGRGLGRRAMDAIVAKVFDELAAHRLWLDVFEHNARARHVYRSAGFVEEGVLRECVKQPDRYASLVVMSLLEDEYRQRRETRA